MSKQAEKFQLTGFAKNEEEKRIQEMLDEEFDVLSFQIKNQYSLNLVKDQFFLSLLFFPLLRDNTKMESINMNKIEMRVIEHQIKQLKFELSTFEEQIFLQFFLSMKL